MSGWEPEIAAIPPERFLLLELVRLCKAYRVEALAWSTVLATLSIEKRPLAEALLAAKTDALESAEFQAVAQFRQIETALIAGTEYLGHLRQMLEHHHPA